MQALKVRVENGKIVGDAPSGLVDGTELDLCLAEPEDDMTQEQLAELNAALDSAWRSMEAGRFRPAADVLAELGAT